MTDKVDAIPVVDFSICSMQSSEPDFVSDGAVAEVARRIVEAFSTIGFVYLSNCGISKELLQSAFSCSKEFFSLPFEVKNQYRGKQESNFQGYFGPEGQIFDPSAPGDLKESFDFNLSVIDAPIWTTEVKPFKSVLLKFFEDCSNLTARILTLLAVGLGIDDIEFFVRCHNSLTCTKPYGSVARTAYYPPVLSGSLKKGQSRLTEHTDWGTITLVFQDDAGGLQVRRKDMKWIDATPIEDTVLVNIADLLQRWTCDRLISTPHRIVIPQDGDRKFVKERQSLLFFGVPDPDVDITCIDGSNRYEPVNTGEYLKQRYIKTMGHY